MGTKPKKQCPYWSWEKLSFVHVQSKVPSQSSARVHKHSESFLWLARFAAFCRCFAQGGPEGVICRSKVEPGETIMNRNGAQSNEEKDPILWGISMEDFSLFSLLNYRFQNGVLVHRAAWSNGCRFGGCVVLVIALPFRCLFKLMFRMLFPAIAASCVQPDRLSFRKISQCFIMK